MSCYYDKVDGWLTDEQRPCPRTHCGFHHGKGRACVSHVDVATGEHTCPACVGKIRTDIRGVVEAYALMPEEAEHDGIESEAADIAGPHANLVRYKWALVNGTAVEELDDLDPYTVLADLEHGIRELLDHAGERIVSDTVSESATYLEWVLTDLARDDEYLLLLEDLAGKVRRLRGYLESVLHDSRSPELGAPCPTCSDETGKGPRLAKRYVSWDQTGAQDHWVCPVNRDHTWSEADYRMRIGVTYLKHAKVLTADQMQEAHGIPPGRLRVWAHRGAVEKRGKDSQGRTLYDVTQAVATSLGGTPAVMSAVE